VLSSPIPPTEFRLLLPEVIWLESDHFAQATALSHDFADEALQWQSYVNALAWLGFNQWLNEKIPERAISLDLVANFSAGVCQLKIGEFKLCLIAIEHVLDEVVYIPTAAIFEPELAAHFYVVQEVCLEEEQVMIRGFLRYDQLTHYLDRVGGLPPIDDRHPIPLSCFDREPNRLLSYCRYLEAISIPLPVSTIAVAPATSIAKLPASLHDPKTDLSQWLQHIVTAGWLAIDSLIDPGASLALSTRNAESSISKGKLIDLGLKLGQQSVALLVTINPETEEKLNVLVQLHPRGGQRCLPPEIELTLRSKAGEILQQVQARGQDNYIQLQSFKGSIGKCFSLEVSLLDSFVKEDFEL
jgi:Protein of unknown function (DUF1822)